MGGRAYAGLEDISLTHYRRAIHCGSGHGVIDVQPAGDALRVTLLSGSTDAAGMREIGQRVRVLFDAASEVSTISAALSRDPILRPLVERMPGIRIPGTWNPFELMVRAILGQQISVAAATTVAGRLVMKHGAIVGLPTQPTLRRLFPTPAKIARARIETLGIIRARANAIRGVASAFVEDPQFLARSRGLDGTVAELRRLPGIGEWTAQYVAMRALGEADAFPASDLGLLRSYGRLAERTVTPRELLSIAERWRPFRGYAAMVLWIADT
jgi:AraC family transcriptional regulator, regulatory protein of adaptative response / DNA-3-methyladenine glycosylase II